MVEVGPNFTPALGLCVRQVRLLCYVANERRGISCLQVRCCDTFVGASSGLLWSFGRRKKGLEKNWMKATSSVLA